MLCCSCSSESSFSRLLEGIILPVSRQIVQLFDALITRPQRLHDIVSSQGLIETLLTVQINSSLYSSSPQVKRAFHVFGGTLQGGQRRVIDDLDASTHRRGRHFGAKRGEVNGLLQSTECLVVLL